MEGGEERRNGSNVIYKMMVLCDLLHIILLYTHSGQFIRYTTTFTNGSLLQTVSHVAVACYINQADALLLFDSTLEWAKRVTYATERGVIVGSQARPIQYLRNSLLGCGCLVSENNQLMREVEGEWQEWCKPTGGPQTTKNGISEHTTRWSLSWTGCCSRPHRVPLLSVQHQKQQLQWTRVHRTVEEWTNIA
jgi:hypothetical protein